MIDPDQNSGDTVYDVRQSANAVTGRAIKLHTFQPIVALKVGHIDQAIRERNLNRYQFGPEGSGCQHWVYLVVSCLEERRWLFPGSKDTAWEAVQNCWSTKATTTGQVELVSKRIGVVYGIEYERYDHGEEEEEEEEEEKEEEEEEEDDDDNGEDEDDDNAGGPVTLPGTYQASDGFYYPVPIGAYLANDRRIYPRPGYYLASNGNYYPRA